MAEMAAANLLAGVRGEPLPTPVVAAGLSWPDSGAVSLPRTRVAGEWGNVDPVSSGTHPWTGSHQFGSDRGDGPPAERGRTSNRPPERLWLADQSTKGYLAERRRLRAKYPPGAWSSRIQVLGLVHARLAERRSIGSGLDPCLPSPTTPPTGIWQETEPEARPVLCSRAGSSAAEHGTFNPLVVGSNPTRLA